MREERMENKAGNLAPALFSFITLRKESFGAILFNPFLPAELQLDESEALIAGMCCGGHLLKEIRKEYQFIFNLAEGAASQKVDQAIEKLNRVAALEFIKKRPSGRTLPGPGPATSAASLSAPKSVIWDVTYACNLNCPHCLTDSGRKRARELDTKGAFHLIDRLAVAKVMYLSLTGGEPFLRPDILRILRHVAGTGMRVEIASNGFEVSQKIIKSLRGLPVFQIQVSIDGIGEEHDRFRGRKGAFRNACQALRRFKQEGLSTSINVTATGRNVDRLPDLIDFAVKAGCDGFKAIPFIPEGRGKRNKCELWLGREGSLKLSRILAQKSHELAGKINISTESTFLFLLNPPPACNIPDGTMTCSAGYDTLNIGADGTAYPCPFLHDFPLGNLLADSMDKIWHESKVLNKLRALKKTAMTGPCQTCSYAPEHCRGGCRAAAYLDCGDLKGSDPLCFRDLLHWQEVSV